MFSNGTVDLDTMIDELPPLRTTQDDRVRALKDELREKKDELEDLKRRRRGRYGRIQALEEEFEAALKGESDRDPREIREERLEVEEEKDRFQEKRTKLKYEIAELEQEVQEAGEEAADRAEEAISERAPDLLEDLTTTAHEVGRALVPVYALGQKVRQNNKSGYILGRTRINPPIDHQLKKKLFGLKQGVTTALEALRDRGHDVDADLIEALNDL